MTGTKAGRILTAGPILKRWGKAIELRRRELGMTQSDLASNVASSQAAISRFERGEQEPPLDLRLSIAQALNTTHRSLFDIDEEVA